MTSPVASAGVSQHDQQQPVYSGSEGTFRVIRISGKGKAAAAIAAVFCARETQCLGLLGCSTFLLSKSSLQFSVYNVRRARDFCPPHATCAVRYINCKISIHRPFMSILSTDRFECANVRFLGQNESHFVQVTD